MLPGFSIRGCKFEFANEAVLPSLSYSISHAHPHSSSHPFTWQDELLVSMQSSRSTNAHSFSEVWKWNIHDYRGLSLSTSERERWGWRREQLSFWHQPPSEFPWRPRPRSGQRRSFCTCWLFEPEEQTVKNSSSFPSPNFKQSVLFYLSHLPLFSLSIVPLPAVTVGDISVAVREKAWHHPSWQTEGEWNAKQLWLHGASALLDEATQKTINAFWVVQPVDQSCLVAVKGFEGEGYINCPQEMVEYMIKSW